jgi:hypothetical protein
VLKVIRPIIQEARLRKGKFRQSPVHELTPEELRVRAETRLINLEKQKADAPVAMREYRDAEQAARDRTAKLRAQRLAREAAEKK